MVDILEKEVSLSFDDTVKRVQDIVTNEGFTVLLTKDIDVVIKTKLGLEDYPRYTTIMACGPELAKMALDASKNVGLLFPCSFVVYEEDNKVIVAHVSIMKIAAEVGLASDAIMAPIIAKTSEMVQTAWGKI
jgi:uncharacterized protein (DUF302 family)